MKIKRFFTLFVIVFLFFILISCSSNGPNNAGGGETENNVVVDTNNKIVYTVDYKIYSSDISDYINRIGNWVKGYNGYISESEQSDDDYAIYIYKVPTSNLNHFLDDVDSLDGISDKNITTKDVTSTYNELEATIEMLEARKTAYLNVLKNDENLSKTEILEINELLDDIEVKLIAANKELGQLANKVNYSTITIKYYKNTNTETYQFFNNYLGYIISIGKTIGSIILYSLPFAIVGGIIVLVILLIKKKNAEN
ncbi:MAG: DUF4349 domain-containing protein [Anaeroplasma sp.]